MYNVHCTMYNVQCTMYNVHPIYNYNICLFRFLYCYFLDASIFIAYSRFIYNTLMPISDIHNIFILDLGSSE